MRVVRSGISDRFETSATCGRCHAQLTVSSEYITLWGRMDPYTYCPECNGEVIVYLVEENRKYVEINDSQIGLPRNKVAIEKYVKVKKPGNFNPPRIRICTYCNSELRVDLSDYGIMNSTRICFNCPVCRKQMEYPSYEKQIELIRKAKENRA